MGSHIFGFFGVRQLFIFTVGKRTRMCALWMKSKVFSIQSKSKAPRSKLMDELN